MDRESLWLLLRRLGIPDKMVKLLKELYNETRSCVLVDGVRSERFEVLSGVMQGCTIAPDLFLNPMVWILDRTTEQCSLGVSIGEETFMDLDYADDVALLAEMLDGRTAGTPGRGCTSRSIDQKRKLSTPGSKARTSRRSR